MSTTIWGSFIGNLIGTLYFLFFQLIGFLLIQFILTKKDRTSRIICGSVLGSILLSWMPALFAFLFDFTIMAHICAAVFCILLILVLFLLKCPHNQFLLPSSQRAFAFFKKHRLFFIMVGVTFIIFSIMLSTHTLSMREDGMHTGQCTYGDINMHLGFITSIAKQHTFPPNYSIAPDTRLSWPFLCDSNSSSIYLLGASLKWSYMLPMYAALLQVMAGFYCIAYSWLKKASQAALAWFFFFYNGGLGFVYFIDWAKESPYKFKDIFTQFYQTPTNLIDNNIRWVNIIVDMLLPQRATLFGYAILFTCIWLLWRCVFNEEYDLFPLTALITASLPMIHTHSFLAMGIISAAWMLMSLIHKLHLEVNLKNPGKIFLAVFLIFMSILQIFVKKYGFPGSSQLVLICLAVLGLLFCLGLWSLIKFIRKHGIKKIAATWGIYLLIILLLAAPQLFYWTFHQSSNNGFTTGLFNWGNLGDNYLWFYIKNWGVILLLLIPAVCACCCRDFSILLPGFLIWFIIELVSFSPNPYDNNKLLYVAYIFFCCISAKYGALVWNRLKSLPGTRLWGILFLFLSGISGVLSMGRELVSDYTLYSSAHLEAALFVDENTPATATFLTNDRHVNEITALTGRNIVNGTSVFLGPHGIYNEQRVKDVQTMFENPKASEDLFKKYHVDYIMISSWERSSYNLNEALFDEMFECIFQCNNDEIKIYKIP